MHQYEDNPTITIVIPVYNVVSYVERCVLSAMHQTCPVTECIIIDDCSTDDSIAHCQKLIDMYNGATHFFILHHDHNRGLSAARNTGTDAATGEYIYYLDSDDEIAEDCIEKLMEPIKRDDSIEMVMGNFVWDYSKMPGERKLQRIRTQFLGKESLLELRRQKDVYRWYYCGRNNVQVGVWNKLLKLDFVKANHLYNREGLLWEDSLWDFYLMRCLKRAVIVNDITYIHYQRQGSIVASIAYAEKLLYFGKIHREIAEHVEPGKRKYETYRWLRNFCHLYVDASENPDYQYAYGVYRSKLIDGRRWLAVCALIAVHCLAKISVGRRLFKEVLKARLRFQR